LPGINAIQSYPGAYTDHVPLLRIGKVGNRFAVECEVKPRAGKQCEQAVPAFHGRISDVFDEPAAAGFDVGRGADLGRGFYSSEAVSGSFALFVRVA
jgi:hypothetical protein